MATIRNPLNPLEENGGFPIFAMVVAIKCGRNWHVAVKNVLGRHTRHQIVHRNEDIFFCSFGAMTISHTDKIPMS